MSSTEDEDWGKVSDLLGPKLVVALNLVLESKALNKLAIGYLALQGKFYANETEMKKMKCTETRQHELCHYWPLQV